MRPITVAGNTPRSQEVIGLLVDQATRAATQALRAQPRDPVAAVEAAIDADTAFYVAQLRQGAGAPGDAPPSAAREQMLITAVERWGVLLREKAAEAVAQSADDPVASVERRLAALHAQAIAIAGSETLSDA